MNDDGEDGDHDSRFTGQSRLPILPLSQNGDFSVTMRQPQTGYAGAGAAPNTSWLKPAPREPIFLTPKYVCASCAELPCAATLRCETRPHDGSRPSSAGMHKDECSGGSTKDPPTSSHQRHSNCLWPGPEREKGVQTADAATHLISKKSLERKQTVASRCGV